MSNLGIISDELRADLEERNAARDTAIARS